jgi:NAD-dependent dihydropyrimidine dehydrogenase PreA subunit
MALAKSILQADKDSCFLCGSNQWLEEHHCFGGYGKRQLSEKYGLKVYLCHKCHNEPPHGVHHNSETRQHLQRVPQEWAMMHYNWTDDDFRNIYGKNYL